MYEEVSFNALHLLLPSSPEKRRNSWFVVLLPTTHNQSCDSTDENGRVNKRAGRISFERRDSLFRTKVLFTRTLFVDKFSLKLAPRMHFILSGTSLPFNFFPSFSPSSFQSFFLSDLLPSFSSNSFFIQHPPNNMLNTSHFFLIKSKAINVQFMNTISFPPFLSHYPFAPC